MTYQSNVLELNRNLNIAHTVFPDEMPSERDWNLQLKVSSSFVYPEPLFNARDMMKQYAQDENYMTKIKRIIDEIK